MRFALVIHWWPRLAKLQQCDRMLCRMPCMIFFAKLQPKPQNIGQRLPLLEHCVERAQLTWNDRQSADVLSNELTTLRRFCCKKKWHCKRFRDSIGLWAMYRPIGLSNCPSIHAASRCTLRLVSLRNPFLPVVLPLHYGGFNSRRLLQKSANLTKGPRMSMDAFWVSLEVHDILGIAQWFRKNLLVLVPPQALLRGFVCALEFHARGAILLEAYDKPIKQSCLHWMCRGV